MADDFRQLLDRLIEREFPSRLAFVKSAWRDKTPSSAASIVRQVISGRMYPPLDVVPDWADALHLTGEDRDRFILLAHLAHCPPAIADEFQAMRTQLEKNAQIHAENQKKIARLQTLIDRMTGSPRRVADGP